MDPVKEAAARRLIGRLDRLARDYGDDYGLPVLNATEMPRMVRIVSDELDRLLGETPAGCYPATPAERDAFAACRESLTWQGWPVGGG